MVEIQKTVDGWFGKIQKDVTKGVSQFTAFLFILIALGAFIGISAAHAYPQHAIWAVIVPAAAGLLAYYNRAFATVVFVVVLLLIFVV